MEKDLNVVGKEGDVPNSLQSITENKPDIVIPKLSDSFYQTSLLEKNCIFYHFEIDKTSEMKVFKSMKLISETVPLIRYNFMREITGSRRICPVPCPCTP